MAKTANISHRGAAAASVPSDGGTTSAQPMTLAEELVLLLLKDDTGFVAPIPEWRMSCALVGSIVLDLSFRDRLDADLTTLTVLDPTPTGDDLLDPTLATIAAATDTQTPRFWIERLALRIGDTEERVFERLVQRGILDHDTAGFWSVSGKVARSGRYPLLDGTMGEEIRTRVMRVLFDGELPYPHDVTVIGLVHSVDGFKAMLTLEEYEQVEARVELLGGMDLFGRAVLAAVRSSYSPPPSVAQAGDALPTVGLMQCLRSASFRSGNLPKFFGEQAERIGSAFKLKLPGKEFVVLAGAEMNHWVGRKGRLYLRTRDYLEKFQTSWGTARSIASMDGAEHYRMRKVVRAGNARTVVEDRLAELFRLGRDHFIDWGVGKVLPGEMTCQRLIGQQIARLSTSIDLPIDVVDGLLKYEFRSLLVNVMEMLPAISLRTPAMRRAYKALVATYAEIHTSHSPGQREGERRDLVDDLLDLHRSDPQFLPETDLEFAFIAPLIAGHYVGSAMSFALYELMSNPDLYERIAAEADALFDNGDPSHAELSMEAIDVTHRFVMENLRLHPVIPLHNRTAANAFEVDGKIVPARSTVMVAFPAAHYMEENFEDPTKFDIERFAPPRNEHRKRGAYHPFGVGTHTCLGSRFSELAMAADLLLLAHHLEIEMVPADYKLKISPLPKFSPNRKFKFRVKRVRNPLPERNRPSPQAKDVT